MREREILSNYVYTIVASLVQNGVEQVVISPGSRSTPLAYAFAHTKEIEVFRQVDERAAAFFALVLQKGEENPLYCYVHQEQRRLTISLRLWRQSMRVFL